MLKHTLEKIESKIKLSPNIPEDKKGINYWILYPAIIVFILAIVALVYFFAIRKKRKK